MIISFKDVIGRERKLNYLISIITELATYISASFTNWNSLE